MTVTEMPPTAEAPADAEAGKKGKGKKDKAKKDKGGKSNLVPAIVLAVGIAAGGFFMGSGGGDAAPVEAAVVEPVTEPGHVVGIESMTVNLANGHYLRVGVSLLPTSEFEVYEDKEHRFHLHPEDESRLRDQIISTFGGQAPTAFTDAAGLETAKADLHRQANALFDDQILEVYFTEFVMQ
ncbi:MAG: flagellar basal body-associated FliL family protein [Acidimicrobiales bacterium]